MTKRTAEMMDPDKSIEMFSLLAKEVPIHWRGGLELVQFLSYKIRKLCPTNDAIPRDVWWIIASYLLDEKYKGVALLPQICKRWKDFYEYFEIERFSIYGRTVSTAQRLAFLLGLNACITEDYASMSLLVNINTRNQGSVSRKLYWLFMNAGQLIVRDSGSPPNYDAIQFCKSLKMYDIHNVSDVVRYSKKLLSFLHTVDGFKLSQDPVYKKAPNGRLEHRAWNRANIVIANPTKKKGDVCVTADYILCALKNHQERAKLFDSLKRYNKMHKLW